MKSVDSARSFSEFSEPAVRRVRIAKTKLGISTFYFLHQGLAVFLHDWSKESPPNTKLKQPPGIKRVPFFCLKGFIREPKPPKKGIRALLGILEKREDLIFLPRQATLKQLFQTLHKLVQGLVD